MGYYVSDKTLEFAEARELLMTTKSAIIAAENQMYQASRSFQNHSDKDKEYCSWVSNVYIPGAVTTGGMIFRKQEPIRDIFRLK